MSYPQTHNYTPTGKTRATPCWFCRGPLAAGESNENIVALCADLTSKVNLNANLFRDAFPKRFIEIGTLEQNLVTVAPVDSTVLKIPFTSSWRCFCIHRTGKQIRTTATSEQSTSENCWFTLV